MGSPIRDTVGKLGDRCGLVRSRQPSFVVRTAGDIVGLDVLFLLADIQLPMPLAPGNCEVL